MRHLKCATLTLLCLFLICSANAYADGIFDDTIGDETIICTSKLPCVGCTYTPGYWKTHSTYGPAPYDDTWALIGEVTPFFLSGQSYYEVLWTPPKGGNVYYILAHAYIAAELNKLNGTSMPQYVFNAFSKATQGFEIYTPEDAAHFSKEKRDKALKLAQILDDYNNGELGPPHCEE